MTNPILITGGFGDFLTLESFMPPEFKANLETVYYATPRDESIAKLFMALPNYPRLTTHFVFDGVNRGLYEKTDVEDYLKSIKTRLPDGWSSVEDWSIKTKFPEITNGQYPYQGSSFLKHTLAKTPDLPAKYITIHPDTETDRSRPLRMFWQAEWDEVLKYLKLLNLPGVVLNTGNYPVPEDSNLINLSNKTTMLESIEILKAGMGYIGVDSWLSVLAAKLFAVPLLFIKSNNPHLDANRQIYFAPRTRFPFILKRFFDG